jgi:hypothetical protein
LAFSRIRILKNWRASGMTGYTVHTGSTEKFSKGWDQIFGNQTAAKTGASQKAPAAKAAKPAKKGKQK